MTAPEGRELVKVAAAFLSLALIGTAVYSNTFSASFQFDDYLYVVDYSRTHPIESFWPPHGTRYFTYLTFALNYLAGGMDVTGYHLVNLGIHVISAALVFLMAGLLMRSPVLAGRGLPSYQISLLAALLFVAHPVQTEAVTYVSQRFASLAAMLYLLSVVLYLGWRLGSGGRGRAAIYAFSLLLAYAAQMTKEIAFTLPFTLLCLELAFFRGPLPGRLARLAPFSLAMAIIPFIMFGPSLGSGGAGVGAEIIELQLRDLHGISRHDYLVTQFRVIVTYLRLLVLPVGQNLDYDYQMIGSLLDPRALASLVLLALIFAGGAGLFVRFLRGGRAHLALVSAGVLWFFVTISVESSIVPIKDLIFEHRLYLPSAGAAIAASAAIFLAASARLGPWKTFAVAVLLAVLPLSVAAYARNRVWQSGVTLYEDALAKSPDKERVRYNLAWSYHKNGELDRAAEQYRQSLRLKPDKEKSLYNLALIHMAKGEDESAIAYFNDTIRVSPSHAFARYNLGVLYHRSKELDRAIENYREAVRAQPGYEDAHYNLALAYMEKGELDFAGAHLSDVLRLNPASVDALVNIGRIYAMEGDRRRAELAYTEALRLRPGQSEAAAGLARLRSGQGAGGEGGR